MFNSTKDSFSYRYPQLLQNSSIGIAIVSCLSGRFLEVNLVFCNMLGYNQSELLSLQINDINLPNNIMTENLLTQIEKPAYHGKRYLKKNGEILATEAKITAIFDEAGNHVEDMYLLKEISEEESVKETYFDLFDNSPDLIYIMDENATFITVNQAVVDKYGYPKEYSVGKTPVIFGAPGMNDMDKVAAHIEKAWQGEPQYLDWWSITATGRIFPKELVLKKGKYFGKEVLVAIGRDISQRHEMEQKLQESYNQLKKANDEITNFIYRASHDLRSPVASLQGLLQVMREEQNPAELEKYMAIMDKQLNKIDNSIGEIIDYRKITTTEVSTSEIDVEKLIYEVLDPLSFSEGFNIIHKNVHANLSKPFVSDKSRLMIILDNLISNAIKYYDKNKEKPHIHIFVAEEKDDSISIVVEDNGIGIGEQHHHRIYDMFYRATNQIKGTGLGLSIVKEAIAKLNGSITLDSELGKGCKFTIKFPNLHRI